MFGGFSERLRRADTYDKSFGGPVCQVPLELFGVYTYNRYG